ncbi:MAG TPA: YhcH/YjgK/YiaL family protein [Chitinivibrionales bacterium]|nr:YhcH/YjgK/YiaL family protein [Chitinivibrionales bacterium]
MAAGKYGLDGDSIFALVQEYATQPKEAKKAEAHLKYIDVQFVYQGIETAGFAPADPAAEIMEDLASKKDMITYKSVPHETSIILAEGMYAILFPGEIHRPRCNYLKESKVRKVVLKVAMDLMR